MTEAGSNNHPPETPSGHRPDFIIGKVTVRPDHSLLLSHRMERRIEPKIMDVLCLLARHAGDVVTREMLIDSVWHVEHGADESLTRAISLLRKTLMELDPDTLYIQTIPRRGYSLSASVRDLSLEDIPRGPVFPPLNRQLSLVQYAIGLVFMGLLAALMVVMVSRVQNSETLPASPSIAVLPFQNLSEDPQLDYFSGGVAEEVLNILSRFEDLKVSGAGSAFTSDDGLMTRAEIGERLGVNHLLQGSVRPDNEGMRISVQLLQTRDNRQIWSNTYQVESSDQDLFSLQRDIAIQVAGALTIALDIQSADRIAGTDTDNLEAYEFYLRGQSFESWRRPDRYAAVQNYQRAVEIDPEYASAISALAMATSSLAWEAATPQETASLLEKGRDLAERALEIDPDLAQASAGIAGFQAAAGEWTEAHASYDHALSLARNSETLSLYAFFLTRTGRLREARVESQAAYDLDPLVPARAAALAIIQVDLGLHEEASANLVKARDETGEPLISPYLSWILEMHRNSLSTTQVEGLLEQLAASAPEAARLLNQISPLLEDRDAAIAVLREAASARKTDFPEQLEVLATLAAWLGDDQLALDLWRRELSGTHLRMLRLWGPRFSSMRTLPGFHDLVESLGLPDYWRVYGWPDACRPSGESFICH